MANVSRLFLFLEDFHCLFDLFRRFYRDCPDGRLTFKQFEHQYSKLMGKPSAKTSDYIKHMFNVYDQDKDQSIDFK